METVLKDGVYWLKNPEVINVDDFSYDNNYPAMLVDFIGYSGNNGKLYAYIEDSSIANSKLFAVKASIDISSLNIFRSCDFNGSIWSVN